MSLHNPAINTPGMTKLPVGINDFETMRTEGYLYVDKTRAIQRMITQGKFYFLSRPRRFGKSVLTTTIQCLFQGKHELFAGLWIAEQHAWDWQAYPVIVLDFTGISNETPELLRQDLEQRLEETARHHGVELSPSSLMSKFRELIDAFFQQTEKPVAILIDEYDKPIIDHLGKGPQELDIAKANRDTLKHFFGVLKDITIASKLRFVFLTGISRFTKVSIFSELNNLNDISMDDAYADLLGYTTAELETYFSAFLDDFAAQRGWSRRDIMTQLAAQYNGYRFAEADIRVYNPCSILKALDLKKLDDFWFETATPTFLTNLLKQMQYDVSGIEGIEVTKTVFNSFDLEKLRPEALLFQSGYLTITDVQDRIYTLDYPNQEVKRAFTEALLFTLADGIEQESSSDVLRLARYLRDRNFEKFFETITAIFASIPYDLQSKRDEAYFHTLFYLMMAASGVDARSSVLTCKGRIDLAVFFADAIDIIEFKCNQSADLALQQIRANGYADRYRGSGKSITLIGINFSTEQKNLADWKVVPDNV